MINRLAQRTIHISQKIELKAGFFSLAMLKRLNFMFFFVAKGFLCGLGISSSWPVGTEAVGRWVAALVARSTRSESGQKERPRENIARFSFICALLGLIFLYTDLPLLSIIYFKVKMRRKFKSNTFGIFFLLSVEILLTYYVILKNQSL